MNLSPLALVALLAIPAAKADSEPQCIPLSPDHWPAQCTARVDRPIFGPELKVPEDLLDDLSLPQVEVPLADSTGKGQGGAVSEVRRADS